MLARKARHGDLALAPQPVDRMQERAERLIFREILGAVGQQHEDWQVRQALQQAVEHGQRVGVGPLQVVHKEHERAHFGQGRQRGDDAVDEPLAVLFGAGRDVGRQRWRRYKPILNAGNDLAQLVQGGSRQRMDHRVRQHVEVAPQRVGQRGKGQIAFQRLARCADNGGSEPLGVAQCLVGQPRLADTRLAMEQHPVAVAFQRGCHAFVQQGDLAVAADERLRKAGVDHGEEGALRQFDRLARRRGDVGRCMNVCRHRWRVDDRARLDLPIEDALVQLLGERAGVGAKFLGENGAAAFVSE